MVWGNAEKIFPDICDNLRFPIGRLREKSKDSKGLSPKTTEMVMVMVFFFVLERNGDGDGAMTVVVMGNSWGW